MIIGLKELMHNYQIETPSYSKKQIVNGYK